MMILLAMMSHSFAWFGGNDVVSAVQAMIYCLVHGSTRFVIGGSGEDVIVN